MYTYGSMSVGARYSKVYRPDHLLDMAGVERLNNFPSIWLPLPPLSSQRAGASAAACGGRLYVCGGAFGAPMLNSVERFDPKARLVLEIALEPIF